VTGSVVTKNYNAGTQLIAVRKDGALSYLLSDHLGSISLTVDSSRSVTASQRFTPWGEVRAPSGTMPTKYSYTGQYSDSYINLLWYGSREYDPAIGRFISPDTIVPTSTQGVQAWDRYGYVNNNPVTYNDPTGHEIPTPLCIFCSILGPNATDFWGLALRGILHFPDAKIIGQGLESIKQDPDIISKQEKMIQEMAANPEYGQDAYTPKHIEPEQIDLGEHGSLSKNVFDQNFWMVHLAMLSATNAKVSADGTITTTWKVTDSFDFEPDWSDTTTRSRWSYWKYNLLATAFGTVLYHGLLNGEPKFPDTATWTTTEYPQECQNCR
jgi:RHS repeat-associated protein